MKLFNTLYAFEAEVVHVITESVEQNRSLRGERATFQSRVVHICLQKVCLNAQIHHNFK